MLALLLAAGALGAKTVDVLRLMVNGSMLWVLGVAPVALLASYLPKRSAASDVSAWIWNCLCMRDGETAKQARYP